MRKELTLNKPSTNLDVISRFIIHQDVVMNAEQELLLQRLQFADEKIRSRKFKRDEIILSLKNRFGVSQWRAENDITDCHKLFGPSRLINKNYLIAQHLDDIALQIQLVKESRKFELLQGLNNSYTNALNAIPEDQTRKEIAPTKIIFINKGKNAANVKTVDQLVAEAEEMIKNIDVTDGDFIEFEEQPGDDN